MNTKIYTAPTNHQSQRQWERGRAATKELLSELYLNKEMSSNDISKIFGVTAPSICNKLKAYNIPIRPNVKDLSGLRFGRLTVIKRIGNNTKGSARWLCQCDCGGRSTPTTNSLKMGVSKSCGCLKIESAKSRSGPNHPSYINGRTNKEGYVLITDRNHPNTNKRGRVLEHVFVMSNHLGRAIAPGETVHHKNGIRYDNRLENLELWNGKHTSGTRVSDMVDFCVDYLKQYSPDKLREGLPCNAK